MSKPIIVSIDGNIGSGKSTLLKQLQDRRASQEEIVFVKEPVDEWASIRDLNGRTMLEMFYEDPDTYAFSFQMMAYISRLAVLKETIEGHPKARVIVTERSLFTDKHIFAEMLYQAGKIKDVDFQIYSRWFNVFAKEYPVSKTVYVRASPETCADRIRRRARDGESVIDLAYLRDCHEYHEAMIREHTRGQELLVLNADLDMGEPGVQEEWIRKVLDFLCWIQ